MKKYEQNDIARIVAKLTRLLDAASWDEITVTMKCNGDRVTIQPCSSVAIAVDRNPQNAGECDYFLVSSPSLPWLGGSTLEEVAEQLAGYADALDQNKKDKARLAELRDDLVNCAGMAEQKWEELFGTYSDWHKDVYGVRPRDVRRPIFAHGVAVLPMRGAVPSAGANLLAALCETGD